MVAQLTSLFKSSKSLLLAYAVPLLLISVLLTFSGTFLTLDRSRSFEPHPEATPSFPGTFKSKSSSKAWHFRLDGGVGGMAIGYVFGLHTATFLSLLIVNNTSMNPLSPTAFFVIWLLSTLPLIALGGRWKVVALVFLGISAGITFSLALSIITHPSLTSRIILAAIMTPLMTIAVLVPSLLPILSQSKLTHATARMASSCLGAFSVTMSIALLTQSPSYHSWANAWERLWVANGSRWGTSKERGFDALFCALWISGALADWAFKRWIGEDPEEKWDTYLAEYATTLPNAHDRAGRFVPLQTFWNRLMRKLHLTSSSPARPCDMIFPGDSAFSKVAVYSPVLATSDDEKIATRFPPEFSVPSDLESKGILKKGRTRHGTSFQRVQVNAGNSEHKSDEQVFNIPRQPTFLKKSKGAKTKERLYRIAENRRRHPVAFKPKDGFSSDSEADDNDPLKTPSGTIEDVTSGQRLGRVDSVVTDLSGTTVHPPSSSGHGPTGAHLVDELDVDSEKVRLRNMKAAFDGRSGAMTSSRSAPVYSDIEEDVTTAYTRGVDRSKYDKPGWKPDFLRRAMSPSSTGNGTATVLPDASTSPPGAVPMTPSLMHALGRIARAQADAYGPRLDVGARPTSPQYHHAIPANHAEHTVIDMDGHDAIHGLPVMGDEQRLAAGKTNWDSFWNEIQVKAAES